MHKEKRTIGVNLNGAIPGTYSFMEEGSLKQSHGDYKPDYKRDMMNSYSFASGSFILTEVDTVKGIVNGTFSGTVKNLKGETLNITDGRIINGTIKSEVCRY